MRVELRTQSLEGSEDSLSLLPALLLGFPVCPHSRLCVMAKGIGHLPYKARHKRLTLEGSTAELGPDNQVPILPHQRRQKSYSVLSGTL